jgi:hypothetical protein
VRRRLPRPDSAVTPSSDGAGISRPHHRAINVRPSQARTSYTWKAQGTVMRALEGAAT